MLRSASFVFINLSQVFEVSMLDDLRSCWSVVWIISDHPKNELLAFSGDCVRDERGDALVFFLGEVELHVSRVLLKSLEQRRSRSSEDVVNFVNLI